MSPALGRQVQRPPEPVPAPPTLDTVLGQVEAADPATFLRQAEAIDRVTEHLQDVIGGYENRTRELETSWAGHSAAAHSELAGRVTADVKRLLRSLAEPGYGNVLRQAGLAVTAAQQQLRALKQQRDQAFAAEPQPPDPVAATARNTQFDSQAARILRQLSIVYEDAGRALTALPGRTVSGSPVPGAPDAPPLSTTTGGGSGAGGQQPLVYSGGSGHPGDGNPGGGYSGDGRPGSGDPGYFIGSTSGRGYSGGDPASSRPDEQVPGVGDYPTPWVLGSGGVSPQLNPVPISTDSPFSTRPLYDPSPGPEMSHWYSGPGFSTRPFCDPSPGPEMSHWYSGPGFVKSSLGKPGDEGAPATGRPFSTRLLGDPSPGPEMSGGHSGPGFVEGSLGKPGEEGAPATGGEVRGGGGSGPQGEGSPGHSARHEPITVKTSSASPSASAPYENVSGGQSGASATSGGANVSTSSASTVKFDSTSNSFESAKSSLSSDSLTSTAQQPVTRPQSSASGLPGSQANLAATDYGAAVSRASGVSGASGAPASGHMMPMTGGMSGGGVGALTHAHVPLVPLAADPSSWDSLAGISGRNGPPGVVGRTDSTSIRALDPEPSNEEYGDDDGD